MLKKSAALGATLLVLAALPAASALPVSAATPAMSWKPMDKAYISIVIDDNNSQLSSLYNLITGEYGFPLCAAVPVNSITDDNIDLLRKIEKSGGEILSHTYNHTVLNGSLDDATIEREICGSYEALLDYGFNVNGIILAGGGGTEDTGVAFRQKLETYTARCYDYSDQYGVSTQYYHPRTGLAANLPGAKSKVDAAVSNKSWDVIYAHGLTKDVAPINEGLWRKFLDHLKAKQEAGELEVVTYRTVHEAFGNYSVKPDFDPIKTHTTTSVTTTTTTAKKTTATTTTAKKPTIKKTTTAKPSSTTISKTTTATTSAATAIGATTTQAPTVSSSTIADTTATATEAVTTTTASETTATTTATATASDQTANPVTKKTALPYILGGGGAVLIAAGGVGVWLFLKKK